MGGRGSSSGKRAGNSQQSKDGFDKHFSSDGGSYRFTGAVPDAAPHIDTSSAEYKEAAAQYNVRVGVTKDGTVFVQKGGLYSRKRTFKSVSDFENETKKRLNSAIKRGESSIAARKKGYITEIEYRLAQSTFRNNPPAQALKKVRTDLQKTQTGIATDVAAARNALAKLDNILMPEIRKRTKK